MPSSRPRVPAAAAWAAGIALLVAATIAAVVAIGGTDSSSGATRPNSAAQLAREGRAARRPDADVPRPTSRAFDAERALKLVELQLRAGPRPAGSRALARVRRSLVARLPDARREPVAGHPGLVNVVGRIPGRTPAIVVAAHYDTQLRPRGFVGANDSAAGTAIVLETAAAMKRALRGARGLRARDGGRPREVRFVLLDGEELPPGATDADFEARGLRGSTAYAAAHASEVGSVVVVDYAGNRGVRLPREPQSDPGLWRDLERAAGRVGTSRVFAGTGRTTITDDHVPFLRRGIPAVDLIDWTYPQKNTADDRLDRLSRGALDAVGETLVETLLAARLR